jgi:hypothetical protein
MEKAIDYMMDAKLSYKGSLVIPDAEPLVDAIEKLRIKFELIAIQTSENKALDSEGYVAPETGRNPWEGLPIVTQKGHPDNFVFAYTSLRKIALDSLTLQQYVPAEVDEQLNDFVASITEAAKLLCRVTGQSVPGL